MLCAGVWSGLSAGAAPSCIGLWGKAHWRLTLTVQSIALLGLHRTVLCPRLRNKARHSAIRVGHCVSVAEHCWRCKNVDNNAFFIIHCIAYGYASIIINFLNHIETRLAYLLVLGKYICYYRPISGMSVSCYLQVYSCTVRINYSL